MAEVQHSFDLHSIDPLILLGMNDSNLDVIQNNFDAKITVRGRKASITGSEKTVKQVEELFSELIFHINKFKKLDTGDIETAIRLIQIDKPPEQAKKELDSVILFTENGYIKPKTAGQQGYFESVQKNEIVFVIGPAGTGKTYLAVAIAIQYLKNKHVKKIILSRPAVEAGENLGFLPGDLKEKIEPYLWPLHDALNDMIPKNKLKKYLENNTIEIIPLAYMRGRTLNNAFVILDEAQNSTTLQMKMFLTRLGGNARAIITGDITQIDLNDKSHSGLVQIQHVLKGIKGIDFFYMDSTDVVRHRLVKEIIEAYDNFNAGGNNSAAGASTESAVKSTK